MIVQIGINQGTPTTNIGLINGYVVDAHVEQHRDEKPYLYLKIDGKPDLASKERGRRWAQSINQIDVEIVKQLADIVREWEISQSHINNISKSVLKKGVTKMTKELTLEDFEVRYANIRRDKPDVKNCSVEGCKNPRDSTKYMGEDTCCAYHRLLFDFWMYNVVEGKNTEMTQRGQRTAFTKWCNKHGKNWCNILVLGMAREPINWEC